MGEGCDAGRAGSVIARCGDSSARPPRDERAPPARRAFSSSARASPGAADVGTLADTDFNSGSVSNRL